MPRATANVVDVVRKDLKTCEGGYVELRRMTYGQMVQRRALMKLTVDMARGKDIKGEMAMASRDISLFEFAHCIVDHNLEDETGRKLNLGSPVDFENLDPRVGQEIEGYIGEMNNIDEDDQGN